MIAYSVRRRRYELGVRIALGATRRDVLALVMRKGALLAGAGVLLGVPAAFAAARATGSLLNRISPNDMVVFLCVPALLFVVALAASYLPARPAARVNPMVARRYE